MSSHSCETTSLTFHSLNRKRCCCFRFQLWIRFHPFVCPCVCVYVPREYFSLVPFNSIISASVSVFMLFFVRLRLPDMSTVTRLVASIRSVKCSTFYSQLFQQQKKPTKNAKILFLVHSVCLYLHEFCIVWGVSSLTSRLSLCGFDCTLEFFISSAHTISLSLSLFRSLLFHLFV